MCKGKRPSLRHIKIWGCEDYVRQEAQNKLEARSEKRLFVGYPEESFGYLFYKPNDNVVFVAQRGVFLEREMISKEDNGSKIDLEEIQESVDEEPIVNTNTQPKPKVIEMFTNMMLIELPLLNEPCLKAHNAALETTVWSWAKRCGYHLNWSSRSQRVLTDLS
ncbi:hypothetical protein Tco_0598109 [Tanacetum coccineum]